MESGDESKDYFRANIWGMRILRQAMSMADILESSNFPKFKKPNAEDDPDAWDTLNKDVLAAGAKNNKQVPIYKFSSNDGWFITPKECRIIYKGIMSILRTPAAMKAWADDDDNLSFIKDFAEFNKNAAKLGGYRVW